MKRLKLGNHRHGADAQFHHHTWGFIGTAAVTAVGGYLSRPRAPNTAGYQNVDLQDEQTRAIEGNLANSSSIEALISRGNAFNADQALALQDKLMPGYSDLTASLSARAKSLADNPYDVPKEVEDNIARISAERGISAGTRGQFNDFSLLRDFGVESLKYGQANINTAQSITGLLASIAPKVNPMSPLSFYVSPQQQASTTTSNNQTNQGIQQGAFNAQQAADNAYRADLWGSLTKISGLGIGSNGQQPDTVTKYPNPGDEFDQVPVLRTGGP